MLLRNARQHAQAPAPGPRGPAPSLSGPLPLPDARPPAPPDPRGGGAAAIGSETGAHPGAAGGSIRRSQNRVQANGVCHLHERVPTGRANQNPALHALLPHPLHRPVAGPLLRVSLLFGARRHSSAGGHLLPGQPLGAQECGYCFSVAKYQCSRLNLVTSSLCSVV